MEAVQRIGTTIHEMDGVSSSIAAAVEVQGAATAEISRNVGETAAAVATVSTRIAEVSHEAGGTGDQAADVSKAIGLMTLAVQDLKTSVIRVVRTSSDEVNRRSHDRMQADLSCRIELGTGQSYEARLQDISTGGALVSGVNVPLVGRVRLRVDGQVFACDAVGGGDAGGRRLRFVPDDSDRAALAELLGRLAGAGRLRAA